MDGYISTGTGALGDREGLRRAFASTAAPGLFTLLRPFLVAWEQLAPSRFREPGEYQELQFGVSRSVAPGGDTEVELNWYSPGVPFLSLKEKPPLSGWGDVDRRELLPHDMEWSEELFAPSYFSFSPGWRRHVEQTLSGFWEEVAATVWLQYSSISDVNGGGDHKHGHVRAVVRLYLAAPVRILTQHAAQGVLTLVLERALEHGHTDLALAEIALDLVERFAFASRRRCPEGCTPCETLGSGQEDFGQPAGQERVGPFSEGTRSRRPSVYLSFHESQLAEGIPKETEQSLSQALRLIQRDHVGTGGTCEAAGTSWSPPGVDFDSFRDTSSAVLKSILPLLEPYIRAAGSASFSSFEEATSSLRGFAVSEVLRAKRRAMESGVADSPGASTAGLRSMRRVTGRAYKEKDLSFEGRASHLAESEGEQPTALGVMDDGRQDFGLRILRFLGDLGTPARLIFQKTDTRLAKKRAKDAPLGDSVNCLQTSVALAATEMGIGDGVAEGKTEFQRVVLQLPLQVFSLTDHTTAGEGDESEIKSKATVMLRLEEIISEAVAAASSAIDRQQRLSACELLYALLCYVHGQASQLLVRLKEQKDKARCSVTSPGRDHGLRHRYLEGEAGEDLSEYRSLLKRERACRVLVAALYKQLLPPMLSLCSGSEGADALAKGMLQPLVWTVLKEVADDSCKRWGEDGVPDERVSSTMPFWGSTGSTVLLHTITIVCRLQHRALAVPGVRPSACR